MRKLFAVFFFVLLLPATAQSFPGEIFKIETVGTEWCGDFDGRPFNRGNNIDLWVSLDSGTQITVSTTSNFAPGTTFPMVGLFYLAGSTTAQIVGNVLFVDGSFATMRAKAKFNAQTGAVNRINGTFIQSEVFFTGCFSSGTFTSIRVQ